MEHPLRVLLLEDSEFDAELILRELRRAGFIPIGQRVDTEADYLACLDDGLDVILADYNLPRFDALQALQRLRERQLDVPYIVVSGTIGDEAAVALIRQGAADYLLKDRLGRLGEAVRQALEQRRLRHEKQRAEAALRASEEHYRSLIANIPDITWRADASGGRLFISPNVERLLGLRPIEIYTGGAPFWHSRIHIDDRERVRAAYAALFSGQAPYDVDYRIQRGDGVWIWLHERAALVDGGDGMACADGVSTDITVRKQAEETLRQAKEAAETANRLKSEFLSTVSHELRTPLTAILGFSQLLSREDSGLEPRQTLHAVRIRQSAEHLIRLIDDLLSLSMIEAGRLEVALAETELPPVLSQVQAELATQAEAKGLTLSVQVPPALPPVLTDPTRLRQILLNLVGNAVKFTDQGRVSVEVRPHEQAIAIVVADTGIGIAPDALDYIFDEFRQVDGGVTRRHGGIGLGLPIARKLSRLLGGRIDVVSQPGVGSTFTLHVPLAGAAMPPGRRRPTIESDAVIVGS